MKGKTMKRTSFLWIFLLGAAIAPHSAALADPSAHGNATIDFSGLDDEEDDAAPPPTAKPSAADNLKSSFFHDAGIKAEEAQRKLDAAKQEAESAKQSATHSSLRGVEGEESGTVDHLRPSPWTTR